MDIGVRTMPIGAPPRRGAPAQIGFGPATGGQRSTRREDIVYIASEVVWPSGIAHREAELNRLAERRRVHLERQQQSAALPESVGSAAAEVTATGAGANRTGVGGLGRLIARLSGSPRRDCGRHSAAVVTPGGHSVKRDTMEW